MVTFKVPGVLGLSDNLLDHDYTGDSVFRWDWYRVPTGNHVRGPLGLSIAPQGASPAKQAIPAVAPAKSKVVKTMAMPAPAMTFTGSKTVMLRRVDWPLFPTRKLKLDDVQQGLTVNCALAAILAAFAHTDSGRTFLRGLVTSVAEASVTSCQGGDFNYFNGPNSMASDRLFKVKLPGFPGEQEISDVFFTNETTPPSMIFMGAKDLVLWSSVIEKAYAALLGSYDQFSDQTTVVWKDVTGKAPQHLSMQKGTTNYHTSDRPYLRQAKKADQVPMMAAIKGNDHGETVLGVMGKSMDTSLISLYNPWAKSERLVSMAHLRIKQTVLYYGKP